MITLFLYDGNMIPNQIFKNRKNREQTGSIAVCSRLKFRDDSMSVTIKQIAELANVSRGTVDRVLNNRSGVSSSTRDKVLKIANELHYQPNFLAKALVNSKENIKIGVILTPDYNPFIHEVLKGIENAQEEFKAFGLEVIIKMMATLEAAEELKIIQELEYAGVNGMAVFPLDHPQIVSVLNDLIKKNIAVVTFNSRADSVNSMCFIGQDHYKGGRTAAGLISKILSSNSEIGIIISTPSLTCHQERLKGFKSVLAEKYPGIHIVDVQTNQDRKEEAFRITLEYCNQYPNLSGIYITGGGVSGVTSALEVAERDSTVRVVCHDLIPDSVELLKKDKIDFVLGQEPTTQGYQIVKTLFEYLVKDIQPPKQIDIPVTIFINESL